MKSFNAFTDFVLPNSNIEKQHWLRREGREALLFALSLRITPFLFIFALELTKSEHPLRIWIFEKYLF